MVFPRQEHWNGLPFPSPGDLPSPGMEPGSPALQADSLPSEPPGVALVVKNLSANAGDVKDLGSVPGWGRSPGGGNGNLLQYSFLEIPMDRGVLMITVHIVAKSQT